MNLTPVHIAALDKAETQMFHCDFCPYLELKAMLAAGNPLDRDRFQILFHDYYGLGIGGLTPEFEEKFFRLLFGGNVIVNGQPDYGGILRALYKIPRKKGDLALPLSFVSKLVAIHREDHPIYDSRVLEFFNAKAPLSIKDADPQPRIDWYVNFLNEVAVDYATWAHNPSVTPILSRLKARDPRLGQCHTVRLMDFLVWKVGRQKLL